jgi:hypothetical protein
MENWLCFELFHNTLISFAVKLCILQFFLKISPLLWFLIYLIPLVSQVSLPYSRVGVAKFLGTILRDFQHLQGCIHGPWIVQQKTVLIWCVCACVCTHACVCTPFSPTPLLMIQTSVQKILCTPTWSSLTSFFLMGRKSLSTLFLNTLRICFSLNVRGSFTPI